MSTTSDELPTDPGARRMIAIANAVCIAEAVGVVIEEEWDHCKVLHEAYKVLAPMRDLRDRNGHLS